MKKIMAFQRIGLTIAALVCSFAFLIQSTSTATADAPTVTNEAGKYQMQFQAVYGGGMTSYYILAWDTDSGRSKMYTGSSQSGGIKAAPSSYAPPSSPL